MNRAHLNRRGNARRVSIWPLRCVYLWRGKLCRCARVRVRTRGCAREMALLGWRGKCFFSAHYWSKLNGALGFGRVMTRASSCRLLFAYSSGSGPHSSNCITLTLFCSLFYHRDLLFYRPVPQVCKSRAGPAQPPRGRDCAPGRLPVRAGDQYAVAVKWICCL